MTISLWKSSEHIFLRMCKMSVMSFSLWKSTVQYISLRMCKMSVMSFILWKSTVQHILLRMCKMSVMSFSLWKSTVEHISLRMCRMSVMSFSLWKSTVAHISQKMCKMSVMSVITELIQSSGRLINLNLTFILFIRLKQFLVTAVTLFWRKLEHTCLTSVAPTAVSHF